MNRHRVVAVALAASLVIPSITMPDIASAHWYGRPYGYGAGAAIMGGLVAGAVIGALTAPVYAAPPAVVVVPPPACPSIYVPRVWNGWEWIGGYWRQTIPTPYGCQ